jgi:phage FluMu protein Com
MALLIRCEQCGRQLRVPDTAAGKKVKCPLCGTIIAAPSTPAVPAATAVESSTPPPARATPPPLPPMAPAVAQPAVAQAIQPQAPAPRVLAPTMVAPIDEDMEEVRPIRRRSFPPLKTPVVIEKDPDKVFKGQMQAELSAEGLSLRQGKKHDLLLPVGTPARYVGKNKLAVTIDDREVTVIIANPRTYQNRLAQDIVAFLKGDKTYLRAKDYVIPLGLYALTVLPLTVLIFTFIWRAPWAEGSWRLWGTIWGGVGGALMGACVAVLQQQRWPTALRVGGCLGLTALGYIAFFVTLLVSGGLGGPLIAANAWKTFSPPGGRFSVDMPGTPVPRNMPGPGGLLLHIWMVELKNPNCAFGVEYGDFPANELNHIPIEQRFVGARQGMLASTPNSELVSERPLTLQEHPGREYVLRIRGHGQMIAQAYIVGNRFYMLLAGGDRFGPSSPDVQKFLKSFRLQGAEQPAPQAKQPGPGQVPDPGPVQGKPREPVPATALPGLIAYWPLDEGNGTRAADASGNGNDAKLAGATAWEQGIRGKALAFVAQGDFLDLGTSARLNFPGEQPFTFSGWFRTQTPSGAIVSFRNSRAGAPVIDITLKAGHVDAVVRADGNEFGEARVNGTRVADGQWHHFALTRNNAGGIELFVDGRSQGQGVGPNSAGAITTDLRAAGAELHWARIRRMGLPFFTGTIDELAIFNRMLSADDIRRLAGR